MTDTNAILLRLSKDESLWAAPLVGALDTLLACADKNIDVDTASVWQFAGKGSQMVCIASYVRGLGVVPATGVLDAVDCPAYFDAMNGHRVLAVDDAQCDPRTKDLTESYLKPNNVYALLDATIRRAGKMVGVLCCEQRNTSRGWGLAEIDMARGLADLAGQLMLISELRRRDQLQSLLLSLAPELGQNHTEKQLAELALKKLVQLFPGIWAAFYRPDPDPGYLQVLSYHAPEAPPAYVNAMQKVHLDSSVLGIAIRERRIVAIRDTGLVQFNQGEQSKALGVVCSIGIPLMHDEVAIGGVIIGVRSQDVIGDDELAAFSLASTSFSVALANARNVHELRHRALHDSLTGLPNRDKLQQDIEHLTGRGSSGSELTMLLLNVKDFRQINDTLGRGSADRLLQQLAERVSAFSRDMGGQAYRLVGDEFAVLLSVGGLVVNSRAQAELLQKIAADPLDAAGLTLILRTRIGVASLPLHGADGYELLRSADTALAWAAADVSGICVYDLLRDTSGPRSLEMVAELRLALENNELTLHLQPKISILNRKLVGCEALLRWVHPRFGNVPPASFIAVAEKADLMGLLTLWVAKRALQHACELRAAGLNISIAINVSAHNMVDMEFPRQLESLITQSGLDASALTLEITETVLMSDPDRAATVIADLAALGLALDIDDFGTGYSSLAYLRRLPLKSLKIDRAFVMELTANLQDVHIVRSTVGLAHGLGLSVIAEGVEDEATLALLGELGCDMAQGFGIGRPQPVSDFITWAKQWA
jgi:diguanylate cyclase (GGDEF)-like protein